MDKIKLFLDEDVHAALATILRKRGFDVEHTQESDRKGRADSEQLEYAVQQKRCLISFNVKDYVLLHNEYVQQGSNIGELSCQNSSRLANRCDEY